MKPTSPGPKSAGAKSSQSESGLDENPTVELSALFEQEPDFEHLPDVHPPAPAPLKPPRPAKAAKAPRPAKATKAPRSPRSGTTTPRPPRATKATPARQAPEPKPAVEPEAVVEPEPIEPETVVAPVVATAHDDATEILARIPDVEPEPGEEAPEPVAVDTADELAVPETAVDDAPLESTAVIDVDEDLDVTTELRAIPETQPLADPVPDPIPEADPISEPDLIPLSEQTAVMAPIDLGPAAHDLRAETAAPPKRRRSKVKLALLAVVAILFLIVGWSVGTALGKPTSESTSAKLAEWGRDHNLGPVVTWLEKQQYKLNPPRTGGKLAGGIRVGNGSPKPTVVPPTHAIEPAHTTAPANLVPLVHDGAYPNEGVWQPLVSSPAGLPMVLGTAIRPDTTHTSYQVGIAWMDPKLVRFELHPGYTEPGGTWSTADTLGTPALEKGLVAAFNAGFRLPDGSSRGGWYLDGKWAYPAHAGAESFVIYKDGRVDIGHWGSQVRMTPDVLAVRQNLDALLIPGAGGTVGINPTVDENNTPTWGYTLGSKLYVPRSGVGITRTGAIVYAAGLTNTRTLATVLRDAGCIRAMELDINAEWTIYTAFERPAGTTAQSTGPITGTKLTPDEQAAADHFLAPSGRDFFAVYAR